MDTRFRTPIPCHIVGHRDIPDGWPGEIVGLGYSVSEDGFGVCVRFFEPPTACLQPIWMLNLDVVVTESAE